MRTKPLIGRTPWFGPRRLGWGWGPVKPAGWAVLGLGVAAAIVLSAVVRHSRWLGLIAVVVMLVVIVLKGTSPGGPDEWAEFKASQDTHPGDPGT